MSARVDNGKAMIVRRDSPASTLERCSLFICCCSKERCSSWQTLHAEPLRRQPCPRRQTTKGTPLGEGESHSRWFPPRRTDFNPFLGGALPNSEPGALAPGLSRRFEKPSYD